MTSGGAGRQTYIAAVLAACCLAGSCGNSQDASEPQAYVAPASVNVRSQLNQKNSNVAVLQHGDRVSLLDVRRRFVKIRTGKGVEGWVDSLDLLSPDDMKRINSERARALRLPSEGAATAYETLNIHLDPNRKSPAFAQIAEGGAVSVLTRKVTVKNAEPARNSFSFEKPKPPARKPRKAAKSSAKGPPMPSPPKPPANWRQLWGADDTNESEAPPLPPPAEKESASNSGKGPVLEDWTLVRTKDDRVGWVLSRNLMMSIPDDVAQYAGGRHITSYFDLGAVNDERNGQKHNWLWTTAGGGDTLDFDSWRVFLWNRRRHRYETSYRQHDLEGYFPVQVNPAEADAAGRTFKLITRDDDGRFRQRTYFFDGTLVHLRGTEDYAPGDANAPGSKMAEVTGAKVADSWLQRSLAAWKRLLARTH